MTLLITPDESLYSMLSDSLLVPLKTALGIDFAEHDERLKDCIRSAAAAVEGWCERAVVAGQITVTVSGVAEEGLMLPVRPVVSVASITRSDSAVATATEWLEVDSRTLKKAIPDGVTLKLVLNVGYDQLPLPIRGAILELAATYFDGVKRPWKPLARPFRAVTYEGA